MSKSMLPALKVSENKRFLMKEDGSPFFWLGDTAWELFHQLNKEEAIHYLETRASQKFNVIQAVALAEMDGLTAPNAYGRKPLLQNNQGEYDPTLPDVSKAGSYDYWQHVDFIVDKAAELGLYIALLPTWGDKYNLAWGKGPAIFDQENAYIYGRWIAERYRQKSNIIWVLGGDRELATRAHFEVIHSMAEGIKAGDQGVHLITFHPRGSSSSSHHVHQEEWLDFNMIQSGHREQHKESYNFVQQDYQREPIKPTFDAEPCYEDHPINFQADNGYFDQVDVRRAAYWAVFRGGFGHTYGHHSVWSMTTEPKDYFIMTWQAALHRPGAEQMQHVRDLLEAYPFFERVPDQSLAVSNYGGVNYISATRGAHYALLYSPSGLPIQVQLGILEGEELEAFWYDPRHGGKESAGLFANQGQKTFVPPSSGRGNDWVLILETKRT